MWPRGELSVEVTNWCRAKGAGVERRWGWTANAEADGEA